MKNIRDRQKDYFATGLKEDVPPVPKNMLLEVTNICNHSCVFCANSKMKRGGGALRLS